MKEARRVVKNTLFLYVKMIITLFSSLYTTRLILDALGTSDYGIFALVASIISMFVFFNAAMATSTQRFMSFAKGKKNDYEEKCVFNIGTILHFCIALIVVILLEGINFFLFNDILNIPINRIEIAKVIYQFMIIGTVFTVLSVPYDAVINANEDMLFVALLGILESFLKLGIAFYVLNAEGDKLFIYGYLMAFTTLVMLVIKVFYSFKKYDEVNFNLKKYFDKKIFKKMYSFAVYTLLGISTEMITNYGQGIILNTFFGTIVNAAQAIAGQINGQLGAFAITMSKALNPLIMKSEGAGNRKLMLEASFTGSRIAFYLLTLFFIPMILEMSTILTYWLGTVPAYTIIFTKLLLLKSLIREFYITLSTAILSVGNIKRFQIYNAILNLFPLPIAYILFKFEFPPYIIYVIFIFYSLSQAALYIYFAKKECGMSIKSYFQEVIFKSIAVFILIFAIDLIPHLIILNDLYRLISVLIMNFFAFMIITWFIGLSPTEKDFILKILLRINFFKNINKV